MSSQKTTTKKRKGFLKLSSSFTPSRRRQWIRGKNKRQNSSFQMYFHEAHLEREKRGKKLNTMDYVLRLPRIVCVACKSGSLVDAKKGINRSSNSCFDRNPLILSFLERLANVSNI